MHGFAYKFSKISLRCGRGRYTPVAYPGDARGADLPPELEYKANLLSLQILDSAFCIKMHYEYVIFMLKRTLKYSADGAYCVINIIYVRV